MIDKNGNTVRRGDIVVCTDSALEKEFDWMSTVECIVTDGFFSSSTKFVPNQEWVGVRFRGEKIDELVYLTWDKIELVESDAPSTDQESITTSLEVGWPANHYPLVRCSLGSHSWDAFVVSVSTDKLLNGILCEVYPGLSRNGKTMWLYAYQVSPIP